MEDAPNQLISEFTNLFRQGPLTIWKEPSILTLMWIKGREGPLKSTKRVLMGSHVKIYLYHISSYSFLPWILSSFEYFPHPSAQKWGFPVSFLVEITSKMHPCVVRKLFKFFLLHKGNLNTETIWTFQGFTITKKNSCTCYIMCLHWFCLIKHLIIPWGWAKATKGWHSLEFLKMVLEKVLLSIS